ncbi:FGGY-family carbohydrate kinase [Paludisphaera mucosa]|uniref:FGGY-family carbohydrate kinase n=1 Tax=Paludisphaera mucosa TaxID=3030827 RepID=A0ABT6F553_9BACT|nr:FGGY-family carbohydrate kinase [Paludisphaera mucosa]MDG3002706.1 FGGY-family carbohydrate kinase [Paludisphaera mucosa]
MSSHQPIVLGLDVGTQSLRAALVDLDGKTVAYGVEPIETTYPRPSWAEQQPRDWWRAAKAATRAALAKAGASPDQVVAIGLDCTACTVVACGIDGEPLRPALLWMDQRAFREADEISATGDPVLRYVSGRVSPEWMLPKALWLKRNEPETFDRAARIVECTDWMMHRLTGAWTLSLNHLAVKWNYARPDGGWPLAMIAAVGLHDLPAKWPEAIVPLGKGDAVLSTSAAEQLGLKAGTPVAQGGIDAYLGMLGLGATGDGDVALIVGSSTCHLAQTRDGVFGSGAGGCYPDATVEGLYTIEAGQTATGSILDWYRRHFAGREQVEADARGVNVYTILDEKAAVVPPGAEGLVVREDWQGNRSPYKNPQARGAIVGLSLAHGPGHVFRALYEATAMGTRHILDDASHFGLKVERVFIGGGGAKSPLWLQIHADVLKKPIHLTREGESCALGSAMTAAVAAGVYKDFDEAAQAMVAVERVVEPNPKHVDVYDELFARYVDLYRRLNDPV